MIKFIDHTYQRWSSKKKNENGAATYSRDIMASQQKNWIKWQEWQKENVLISTCPRLSDVAPVDYRGKYDTIIQYLHCYPYKKPLHYIRNIYNALAQHTTFREVIFLSAYQAYVYRINLYAQKARIPIRAIFIPMAINNEKPRLIHHANEKIPKYDDRIIWFGNIYKGKSELFREFSNKLNKAGYKLDYISRGLFNGRRKLSQMDAWNEVSYYKYGIGVGRCALEMYALGLKVMIAGSYFGGILMTEQDIQIQQSTNFNGRLITYDRDVQSCLESLNHSLTPNFPSIHQINHSKEIPLS